MADFDKRKMKEDDSIGTFIGKLTEISSRSASLGEIIEEPKLVKKFLKSLPRKKFIHMVASIEQMLDLNTTSFEERISEEEEEQHDDNGKLMYGSHDSSQDSSAFGRGRGHGGRGNWRGGRGLTKLGSKIKD